MIDAHRSGIFGVVVGVGLFMAGLGCGESAPFPRAFDPQDRPASDVPGGASNEGSPGHDDPGVDGGPPSGGGPGVLSALSLDTPDAPHLLEVRSLTAVRVHADGEEVALEPHEVSFTVTIVQWADREEPYTHTPLENSSITVPFNVGSVGFGFWSRVELHLRLTSNEYDVACHLAFDPDGVVSGVSRVEEGTDFAFGELVCPDADSDVGLLIEFRVAADPREPDPATEADFECDDSPLPAHGNIAVGTLSCPSFDTMGSHTFEVRMWAEPLEALSGDTEFSVQAQLSHPAEIVEAYRSFVGTAVVSQASVEIAQADGGNPMTVAIGEPCTLDYDQGGSAEAGPLSVTTGVEAARWDATSGSVTVEATEVKFVLGSPVNGTLSTHPVPAPGCSWVEVPRLTFP